MCDMHVGVVVNHPLEVSDPSYEVPPGRARAGRELCFHQAPASRSRPTSGPGERPRAVWRQPEPAWSPPGHGRVSYSP